LRANVLRCLGILLGAAAITLAFVDWTDSLALRVAVPLMLVALDGGLRRDWRSTAHLGVLVGLLLISMAFHGRVAERARVFAFVVLYAGLLVVSMRLRRRFGK
jgi:hypothetical protein